MWMYNRIGEVVKCPHTSFKALIELLVSVNVIIFDIQNYKLY